MEEKVKKTVKLPASGDKKVVENEGRLSYEQLNQVCNELFQQNQQLVQKVRALSVENSMKRLDYLFKVVELSTQIKDSDFVNQCLDEIKETITIPEEPAEEKKA